MLPTPHTSTFAETTLDSQPGQAQEGGYGFLGRYRLDRMIGHGAMGAVFEAFDSTLGRTIAIKTIYTQPDQADAGFDTATIDAAILQEARTAATLNHPHIVTVYDAGRATSTVLKRELPYVAMELLQGMDLRQRIAQRPCLGQREAVALVGKLALALDHAHKGGVLHRDIKPANVFIGKNGTPKILDFGLAKFTSRAAHSASASGGQVIAGSPQYMSPEMMLSTHDTAQKVDVRSDVYSLGVILYELLCGKQPFTAPTLALLQERIARTPPEAPHLVNPAIPRDLSRIMLQALAKKPADRYRSAGQLARELRRWGTGPAEGDAPAEGAQQSAPAAPLANSQARSPSTLSEFLFPTVPPSLPMLANRPRHKRATSDNSAAWLVAGLAGLAALGVSLWLWLDTGASGTVPITPTVGSGNTRGRGTNSEPMPATAGFAAGTAAAPTGVPATAEAPAMLSAPTPASLPAFPPAPAPVPAPNSTPAASVAAVFAGAAAGRAQTTTAVAAGGRIRILVTPWGEVEVDGKKMGVSPPLTMLSLEPGEHTVVLRNADYAARTFRVKVETDKTERIAHTFR